VTQVVTAEVLVVDDDPSIGEALERGLMLEGFGVQVTRNGKEAVRLVEQLRPDVVILDLGLPDLDGVGVIKKLRAKGHETPICILSARTDVDDRVAGLQAGADDYLVKPFAFAELVARVEALLRRSSSDVPAPMQVGELRIDPIRRQASIGGRELDFTRREFELLTVLAQNAGIVMPRQQLLSLVWGHDYELDGNVVDVFAGYLRRKLEANGEKRVLHTMRGIGFVLRAES
jgi:two-component system, OmpR family, response regulator PrrA